MRPAARGLFRAWRAGIPLGPRWVARCDVTTRLGVCALPDWGLRSVDSFFTVVSLVYISMLNRYLSTIRVQIPSMITVDYYRLRSWQENIPWNSTPPAVTFYELGWGFVTFADCTYYRGSSKMQVASGILWPLTTIAPLNIFTYYFRVRVSPATPRVSVVPRIRARDPDSVWQVADAHHDVSGALPADHGLHQQIQLLRSK